MAFGQSTESQPGLGAQHPKGTLTRLLQTRHKPGRPRLPHTKRFVSGGYKVVQCPQNINKKSFLAEVPLLSVPATSSQAAG